MPRDGNQSSKTLSEQLSRRKMLRWGAAGSAAALAGCGGDGGSDGGTTEGSDGGSDGGTDSTSDGGTDSTSDGDSGGEPVTNRFIDYTTDDPTNYQYNHYALELSMAHANQNDYFQTYHIGRDEFIPYGVEVSNYDRANETAELQVREGLTWHDGSDVTAEDLYAKFACEAIMNATINAFTTGFEVTGDRTLEFSLDGSVSQEVFQHALSNYWIDVKSDLYESRVEIYEEASDPASRRADLEQWTLDEPYGNGPFQFLERDSTRFRMELYEDHPEADQINWDYWDVRRASTDTAAVLLGGEIDGMRNYTPPSSVMSAKPDWLQTGNLPALWGQSIPFNNAHEDFGNVRVRQAMTEFISREEAANNYGQFGQPVVAPSGLIGNIDGQNEPSDAWQSWISDDMVDTLHRYQNPERGGDLLRGEGYEKNNGEWLNPNGDPLEARIKVPAGTTDWHPVVQTAVSNLNSQGIRASMVTIESTSYWNDHYLAGNHQMAATGWTLQHTLPYYNFDMYYRQEAPYYNLDEPNSVMVPPTGEPDGELQEVTPVDMLEELRNSSGDRQTELRDQLAWTMNQHVPMLPMTEINDTVWFTTDDWEVPSPDSEKYQAKWPLWRFPRNGDLNVKMQ